MKATILALAFLFSVVYSQTVPSCAQTCDPTVTAPQCPIGAECVDAGYGRYICLCRGDYENACTSEGRFTCQPRNGTVPTGCGSRFPNGCPENADCISSTTSSGSTERYCVCRSPYTMTSDLRCMIPCPDNAHPVQIDGQWRCVCNDGFAADPTVNFLYCRPVTTTPNCDNYECPTGYRCYPTSTGPVCRPDDTFPRCGYNFRCASDREICIDTTTGPVCRCREGFGGPDCRYRLCVVPVDSSGAVIGEPGCYFMVNGSAICVTSTDTTRPPYCVCRDGYSGENCDQIDTRCDSVECTAANSHCEEGVCICDVGFTPARIDSAGNWACVRIEDPTVCENYALDCNGNRICIRTSDTPTDVHCECPLEYGAYDCTRPACTENADCMRSTNSHAYCVRSTREGVPNFCACEPGYTGENCDTQVTCDVTTCGDTTRYDCNNEGGCGCRTGLTGADCNTTVPTTQCVTFYVHIREGETVATTIDEVRTRLVELLQVDRLNIVIEGPYDLRDGLITYLVTICGDSNVDQTATQSSLEAIVSGGEADNGLAIEAIGDLPAETSAGDGGDGDGGDGDGDSSTAAQVAVSAVAFAVATFAF